MSASRCAPLVVLLIGSLAATPAEAQRRGFVPGEALVLVEPGTLALPPGRNRAALDEIIMPAGRAKDVLARRQLRFARQAVRNWPSIASAMPSASFRALRKGQQLAPDQLVDLGYLHVLEFGENAEVRGIVAELKDAPGIVFAEPNYRVFSLTSRPSFAAPSVRVRTPRSAFALFPNDLAFGYGWNWGFYRAIGGEWDINAPDAWSLQTGLSAIKIGVLEPGGMQTNHPDLATALVAQYDFDDDDSDVSEGAPGGWHGTATAGIALARTNDAFGSAGLCGGWGGGSGGCSLIYARMGDASGVAAAVSWATSQGAKVLSNSWSNEQVSYSVFLAFRNAWIYGLLPTASMGNSESEDEPPSTFSDIVMSVGATDQNGHRVTSPPYWFTSNTGNWISVMAPGVEHWSDSLGSTIASFSGTSASTPFVSGLAGLLLSEAQHLGLALTGSDVRQIIQQTARQIEERAAGWNPETGYGLIDAGRAIQVLQAPNELGTVTLGPVSATCYAMGDWESWTFWADYQLYFLRRCEVRRAITFSGPYVTPPMVWGRGVSGGGITGSNPNAQVYWTGVVDGSVTTTGATLKTYTYWTGSGWYPGEPSSLSWGYAVLGQPEPFIVTADAPGLVTVKSVQNLYGSANHPAHGWQWDRSYDGGAWEYWSSNQNSQFVAYAGQYVLDWCLLAVRNSNGATGYGYATTYVCIPLSRCDVMPVSPQTRPIAASSEGADRSGGHLPSNTALQQLGVSAVGGMFGSGLWISRETRSESVAVQLYALSGGHDQQSASDAWPNSLRASGATRSLSIPLRSATLQLEESQEPIAQTRSAVRARIRAATRNAGYRLSFSVDPDLGRDPSDDQLMWVDSVSVAVVVDPDSGAVAFGWAGTPEASRATIREYGASADAREPNSGRGAFREQRMPSRVLGTPGDVRFVMTLPPLNAGARGELSAVFVEARGATVRAALAAVLAARARLGADVSPSPSADSSAGPTLAVRQFFATDALQFGLSRHPPEGPSFSVTGRAPSASELARLRSEGVTAVSLSVSAPEGAARIRITVLDARGRVVRRAIDDAVESGIYVYRWDGLSDGGARMPAGVYQVVVEGLGQRRRTTLVLTR